MKKRALAAFLWFMSGWLIGALVAFAIGISPVVAPITAAAAAGLVFADPFAIFGTRPDAKAVAASATEETGRELA